MLTQIQRDAMTRAQAGDFSLADAIELLHDDRRWFRAELLVGGISQGGRLQYLVYGNNPACEECDDGKVDCERCTKGQATCAECGHVDKCKECSGTGQVDCDECSGAGDREPHLFRDGGDWKYVVTLNGDVRYDDAKHDLSDTPPLEITLTARRAREIIAAYRKEAGNAPPPEQATMSVVEQVAAA